MRRRRAVRAEPRAVRASAHHFLWLVVWAPWARGRRTTYRQSQISDDNGYTQGNGYYPRPTPPASTRVHEKVRYEDR